MGQRSRETTADPVRPLASPGDAPEHKLPISRVLHWAEMARPEYTALLSHARGLTQEEW